jgi:sarcosine oxidase, subunit gamma
MVDTVKGRAVLHVRDPKAAGLNGQILRAQPYGGGHALQLGPDEWLLFDCAVPAIAAPHSLVNVSHRQVGLVLVGMRIQEVLSTGVALDLTQEAFPVGMATRTLFGKAEIILWRSAADAWHVEAWRSFLPYVSQFLKQAVADLP